MGFLGSLTGWDQQSQAHNAVVASHFVEHASPETKRQIIERIIEIQCDVQGRYAGSPDHILDKLNEQPRAVQMNFVALACNSLGIRPAIRGLQFNAVQNPYRANDESTTEKIDFTVRWINKRYLAGTSWPGNSQRVNFREWLGEEAKTAILNCPSCAQSVRLPAGKNLRVKCPSCDHAWIEHT